MQAEVRHRTPWPNTTFKLGTGTNVHELAAKLLQRVDSASGLYQMVHVLGHGVVLSCRGQKVRAHYYEEMPMDYFNRRFRGMARFMLVFGYSTPQRQPYQQSMQGGTGFGPLVYHYPGHCSKNIRRKSKKAPRKDSDGFYSVEPKEILEIFETLHTKWDTSIVREQVSQYLRVRIRHTKKKAVVGPREFGPKLGLGAPEFRQVGDTFPLTAVDFIVQNALPGSVVVRRIRVGEQYLPLVK